MDETADLKEMAVDQKLLETSSFSNESSEEKREQMRENEN